MSSPGAVVLITGATSGIGKATAERLAAAVFRVFGTSCDPAGKTASGYELLPLELSSDESVSACVVAVAGRTGGDRRPDEQRRDRDLGGSRGGDARGGAAALSGNFFGVVRMTNAVLQLMRAKQSGVVINMSSSGGIAAIPFAAFYCATIFALEGYTEALRLELRPLGIAATVVAPGPISNPTTAPPDDPVRSTLDDPKMERPPRPSSARRSAGRESPQDSAEDDSVEACWRTCHEKTTAEVVEQSGCGCMKPSSGTIQGTRPLTLLCIAKYTAPTIKLPEGVMHVREALDRLDQIHNQLTRAEIYRGFRVPTVAAIGVLGLGAAAFQPFVPAVGFVWYWTVVAFVSAVLGLAAALHSYAYREDEFDRRRTRRVMAQFLPCLLAGAAATLGIARAPELVSFLPGLWAVLFGLGIIAARPHLPQAIGLVGFGYVVVGAALLLRTNSATEPNGWAVGGVFGIGHLATALVLWRGTERRAERESNG